MKVKTNVNIFTFIWKVVKQQTRQETKQASHSLAGLERLVMEGHLLFQWHAVRSKTKCTYCILYCNKRSFNTNAIWKI